MASGFPGGGPESYGGIPARSILQNTNLNTNSNPSHPHPISSYRTSNSQQLPQIFLDPTSSASPLQIPQIQQHRLTSTTPTSTLMGKRTLDEFQAAAHHHHHQLLLQHQHNNPNPTPPNPNPNPNPNPKMAALNNLLLLRSVKPRMFQYHPSMSPISIFSPMELSHNDDNNNNNNNNTSSRRNTTLPPQLSNYSFNNNNNNNSLYNHPHQRQPLLHLQQQQQQQLLQLRGPQPMMNMFQNLNGGVVAPQQDPSFSAEKKLIVDKKLQELEKQLLEDDEEVNGDENDVVSVITNIDNPNIDATTNCNCEWSQAILHNLNLIAAAPTTTTTNNNNNNNSPNPISPSSSSSSSSASVTTPVPSFSKQTLLEAASAVSEGRNDVALEILCRASNPPSGGNPEHKLMDYLCLALKSRVNPSPVPEMFSKEHAESTHSLYELSPCFKLGFMAANLAILDAASDHDSIHVIDFDVLQGGQYVNLLHALSSAGPNRKIPSLLKLTAVHDATIAVHEEKDMLMEAGEMLTRLAERLGVQFCFNAVGLSKPNDLSRASVGVGTDEVLAVNFAFKLYRIPDESVSVDNPRDELLRRMKGLCPVVVTLVEQEMNANTAPFMARVTEVSSFYGALLESIEATVTRENSERAKVEKFIGWRVVNSVACEGRERVERCEVFGKWRARFGMAGFGLKPMGHGIAESMRSRLNSGNTVNPGFTVKEESGGVCFAWMGKTLTVASSWR